jgi:hypothetical protein
MSLIGVQPMPPEWVSAQVISTMVLVVIFYASITAERLLW